MRTKNKEYDIVMGVDIAEFRFGYVRTTKMLSKSYMNKKSDLDLLSSMNVEGHE